VSAEIDADDREIELIGGGGGIFDVEVDGRLVFSKFEVQRFPHVGEITELLTRL